MGLPTRVEICIDSLEGGQTAWRAGADRVELCANLVEGGTTPSAGMVGHVCRRLEIPVYVLIRPRGGDFLYTNDEQAIMCADIEHAKTCGAAGVVTGALNADGSIDESACRGLIAAARPMAVTFHRAFDMSADPVAALEQIVSLGAERLLTSGQAANAWSGRKLIRELVARADKRINIVAGGGITAANVRNLLEACAVQEVHLSASASRESGMKFRNSEVVMGKKYHPEEYQQRVTDRNQIKEIIHLIRR